MLSDTPSREVQSVQTAFQLMDVLQALGSATSTQLTAQLDLSRSTVHNYLTTLERMGYVVNEEGNYRLGLRFLTYGVAAKNSLSVGAPILQTLQSVAGELSQPTWWVAEEFGRGLFLEVSIPNGQTATYGSIGKRSFLHTHALGKAILARSSDQYVEQIIEYHNLPKRTTRTTTDVETLFQELEEIRNQGFAVSEGEAALGILSIGTSFQDMADRVHAIGIFGDSRELTDTHTGDIGGILMESANSLENRLRMEE